MIRLTAPPITAAAFAPFGEVIEVAGGGDGTLINAGLCRRYTDLAGLDVADGRVGLSLFQAQIRPLPLICDLLERHPLGAQCFVPMGGSRYLVVVAPDADGAPGPARAFTAEGHQAVNIARNTWHGVLAPIGGTGLFAVLDYVGGRPNLQEHRLDLPYEVTPGGV